jgi:hypothetical protein
MKVLTAALAMGAILVPTLAHAGKLVTAPLDVQFNAYCAAAYHGSSRSVSVNIDAFGTGGGGGRFKMGPANRIVSVEVRCAPDAGVCTSACNLVTVADKADFGLIMCTWREVGPDYAVQNCVEGR